MKILKNPKLQQKEKPKENIDNLSLNQNKQYKTQTILEEGINISFSKADDLSTSLKEIKNTERATYSLDTKNPNLLNIEGFDKGRNSTFSMQYDKSTGTYISRGEA